MQIWAGSIKTPIFLEGMYSLISTHSFSSLSLSGSLHGALSLLFSLSEDLPQESTAFSQQTAAGVGRTRRQTQTHTHTPPPAWCQQVVIGNGVRYSLSLCLSGCLDHVGSVSCYATCLCNQSCSHRKVAWLDEQIPLRSADVTAVLDPPRP